MVHQLHLIHPSPEWTGTMDELAAKVLGDYDEVTDKSAYHIVPRSEIPADRDFRNAWEYDFTDSYDGVGA